MDSVGFTIIHIFQFEIIKLDKIRYVIVYTSLAIFKKKKKKKKKLDLAKE